jgi:hypothetical protein
MVGNPLIKKVVNTIPITSIRAITLLDVMRPKQLKLSSEFPGYS